jgi:hypothetical protein
MYIMKLISISQACSGHASTRLGALREFIGIAGLRALNVGELSPDVQEEPLGGKIAHKQF